MRARHLALSGLLAGLLCGGAILHGWAAAPPSFQELEESLTCQCGCGLTVHSCNHLQCDSALPLRAEIREQIKLGKSKEQVLAHFADKYGEKILSSPTRTGFNLTAWVMPFALVLVGGVFVVLVVVRWTHRRPASPGPGAKGAAQAPSEHQKILERELEEFES
ncbi:MAG: cytochrome c-type biogenesis protein CcmH [Deltaproteobacteria bacterium]|nr:cytochrome c-type biogenesis protein CcmH [Deltaproteobacteria bacterium]